MGGSRQIVKNFSISTLSLRLRWAIAPVICFQQLSYWCFFCCIWKIGIFKVFVGRWFMNSHDAEPGLYNNDLHVTGPRHLGLRCEGRKGPEERLDYFTVLPSPCVLVTLWLKLTQGQKVCVSPDSGSCHCNFSPHCPPASPPTPPRWPRFVAVRQADIRQSSDR